MSRAVEPVLEPTAVGISGRIRHDTRTLSRLVNGPALAAPSASTPRLPDVTALTLASPEPTADLTEWHADPLEQTADPVEQAEYLTELQSECLELAAGLVELAADLVE